MSPLAIRAKPGIATPVTTCPSKSSATPHAGRPLKHLEVRRAHAQRGATAIEFALVFPLFFSVVYAIVMFSLILVAQQNLTLAASEGARAALNWQANSGYADALSRRTDAACTAAKLVTAALVQKMKCQSANATCNGGMQCVTVTLSYDYSNNPIVPTLPLLSFAVPSLLTSTAIVQLNPENIQ
jgi:Flp pilus assembly protein TadG